MWCSCLFEQNLEAGVCGGLTAEGWALRQGAGWAAQNGAELREKEDISLELVTAGKGRAAFQLAWRLYQGMCVTGGLGGAVHWATPSASTAQRRSDVIRLVDCGAVFLPFHTGMCFCLLSVLLVTTFHQPVFVGVVSPRYQWQKIRQPNYYLLRLCTQIRPLWKVLLAWDNFYFTFFFLQNHIISFTARGHMYTLSKFIFFALVIQTNSISHSLKIDTKNVPMSLNKPFTSMNPDEAESD